MFVPQKLEGRMIWVPCSVRLTLSPNAASRVCICSQLLLMIYNPVEIALLHRCPCIHHILLKEVATPKQQRLLSRSRMQPVCIIALLGNIWSLLFLISVKMSRNFFMPTILTMRKEQDIVEGGVGRIKMTDLFQTSTSEPKNDVMVIWTLLRSISRNDDSNLIVGSGQIVTLKILISLCMKSNGYSILLLCWLFPQDLICLFVELHIRMR